jgi:hypothetical protein
MQSDQQAATRRTRWHRRQRPFGVGSYRWPIKFEGLFSPKGDTENRIAGGRERHTADAQNYGEQAVNDPTETLMPLLNLSRSGYFARLHALMQHFVLVERRSE